MTVIRPNAISGITSLTAQGDAINFFKSDGTSGGLEIGGARINATGISTFAAIKVGTAQTLDASGINVTGVITATSFKGDGSTLTGVAATSNISTNAIVNSGITTVAAGSAAAPSITPTGDSDTGIFFPSADTIAFGEGGAEAARFDSSGRLLIGTSTVPSNKNTVTPTFAISASGVNGAAQITRHTSVGAGGALLELSATRGTSNTDYTILQSGDGIGTVDFLGADGNEFVVAASIQAAVDGTPGDNDMPGRLVFLTTADGASSPTERARIDSSGRFGLGTTSPGELLHVYNSAATSRLIVGPNGTGAATPNALALEQDNTGYTVCHVRNLYNNAGLGELRLGGYGFTTFTSGSSQTERARIDSSGRLLVNTSSADTNYRYIGSTGSSYTPVVQIKGSWPNGSLALNTTNDGSVLWLANSENSSTSGRNFGVISFNGNDGSLLRDAATIAAYADGATGSGDMPGRLIFSTTADGAGFPTEAMRINNQRELLIGTTTRTANGGVLQVSNGITFPATQSACSNANTLDDYEEGSWTPSLTDGYTRTYNNRVGRYVKIGSFVYVFGQISGAGRSGAPGVYAYITLPFSASSMSQIQQPLTIMQTYGITHTSIITAAAQWDAPTELRIYETTANANSNYLAPGNIPGYFEMGFFYVFYTA